MLILERKLENALYDPGVETEWEISFDRLMIEEKTERNFPFRSVTIEQSGKPCSPNAAEEGRRNPERERRQ